MLGAEVDPIGIWGGDCPARDGQKRIDTRDATYARGKVGLWTKADSVTAFAALTVSEPWSERGAAASCASPNDNYL